MKSLSSRKKSSLEIALSQSFISSNVLSSRPRSRKRTNPNPPNFRPLKFESLEKRDLLTASSLSDGEYADIRSEYAGFDLPERPDDLNVFVLEASELANNGGLAALQKAIDSAKKSTKSDLIVVRTTSDYYKITYETLSNDKLAINNFPAASGDLTIVAWGESSLEINAAGTLKNAATVYNNDNIVRLGNLKLTESLTNGIRSTESRLFVKNCVVEGNSGLDGAGIFVYGGEVVVNRSFIQNNAATRYGGGIYIAGSSSNEPTSVIIQCSVVDKNSAVYGGGIYNRDGDLTVVNATIVDNDVLHSGGGIYQASSVDAALYNTIVIDNSSATSTQNNIETAAEKNVLGFCSLSDFTQWTYQDETVQTRSVSVSADETSPNIRYVEGDQIFTANADEDEYQLTVSGKAFDAGRLFSFMTDESDSLLPAYQNDVVGSSQIIGSTTDVGAYELTAETPSMTVTTPLDVVDAFDGLISLREAATVYSGDGNDGTTDYGIYLYNGPAGPNYTIVDFASNMLNQTITLNDEIVLPKVLEIDATSLSATSGARNVTVSGNNTKRVFTVTGGNSTNNVYLTALNIVAGNGTGTLNSGYGGGVLNTGYLTFKNTDLYNNAASKNGGAVANRGTLTFVNTDCYTNTAVYGGALFNSGTASAGSGCKFYSNTVSKNGGAFSNISTLTTDSGGTVTGGTLGVLNLTGSSIYGNTATNGYGGGIGNWGNANITNCQIYSNTAGVNGGAITNGPAFILSQVDNDQTIFNSLPTSSLTLTTSTIGGSATYANTAGYGGGIVNSTTLNVYGCSFSYNKATINGGGISNTIGGVLTLGNSGTTQTSFSYNEADSGFGGGLLTVNAATLSVSSSSTVTFSNNSDSTSINGGTGDGNFTTGNASLPIAYVYNSTSNSATMTAAASSALPSLNSPNNFGVLESIELQLGSTLNLSSVSSGNLIFDFDLDDDGTADVQASSVLNAADLGTSPGTRFASATIKNAQGVVFDTIPITIALSERPPAFRFEKNSFDDDPLLFLKIDVASRLFDDCSIDWGDGSAETIAANDDSVALIHYYETPGDYAVSIRSNQENAAVRFLLNHRVSNLRLASNDEENPAAVQSEPSKIIEFNSNKTLIPPFSSSNPDDEFAFPISRKTLSPVQSRFLVIEEIFMNPNILDFDFIDENFVSPFVRSSASNDRTNDVWEQNENEPSQNGVLRAVNFVAYKETSDKDESDDSDSTSSLVDDNLFLMIL